MTITTIKRVQTNRHWWYTVENCNVEVEDQPNSGVRIMEHDDNNKAGRLLLSVNLEDALLLRDALNELYPPDKVPQGSN